MTDKLDGETLVRALLAYKRGEPRVCSMVKAPNPEDEDRRRITRERKVLTNERIQHVDRIKGLLFAQGICGYEPLLLLGRILLAGCAADVFDDLLCRRFPGSGFLSHLRSFERLR